MYGSQPIPLSPRIKVSFGWRSQTPDRITEAQISSIWSGATTVHEPADAGCWMFWTA